MTCDKCHGYINTVGCKCEVAELKAQLAEKDKQIKSMRNCSNCANFNELEFFAKCYVDKGAKVNFVMCRDDGYGNWELKATQ